MTSALANAKSSTRGSQWYTLGRDNPRIRTPNLDRLANEGVQFD